MADIPMLQAYASFMDAVMFIKNNMHVAPNASATKKRISKAIGLSPNASYGSYAFELGIQLIENGYGEKVNRFLKNMNMGADLNKRVLAEKKSKK